MNHRTDKLRSKMSEEEIDALLVTTPENIRYLTGFTGSTASLLITVSSADLFTDFRYQEQATEELGSGETGLNIYHEDMIKEMAAAIKRLNIRSLGFEGDNVTVVEATKLDDTLGDRYELEPTRSLVEDLRSIKDGEEIDSIRKAAQLVGKALEWLHEIVRPGVEERRLSAELEYRLKIEGADKVPFEPVVASGARSSMPHAGSSPKAIEQGQGLLIDVGAMVNGYCCDVTRVLFLGKPTSRYEEMFELVRRAQDAALESIKPGTSCAEADLAARRVIEESGCLESFGHGLGHGVGLDVHEAPTLSGRSKGTLEPGMVFTVEPGVYLEGWGGIRLEDTVLLTEEGPEILSDYLRGNIIALE